MRLSIKSSAARILPAEAGSHPSRGRTAMTTIDRRYFILSSMALPAALKASALQSPNNTVRVAVVGFNGRGKAHIQAYLKMPNVEIAALCDVDESVVASGCKMIEAAGKKRPATYADIRKVLDDKSIDAVSIA